MLSEKPIAATVEEAQALLKWYHQNVDTRKVTWSIAENWRFLNSFDHAREQVKNAGKLLGFRVKVSNMVSPGGKYIGALSPCASPNLYIGQLSDAKC